MDFLVTIIELLCTLYQTVLGIIIPSLKSIGQFVHAYINEKDLNVSDGRTDGLTLNVEKLRFNKHSKISYYKIILKIKFPDCF